MITFNKSNLNISIEEITSRKIDTIIVTFSSLNKGQLTASIDGYETSVLEGELEGQTLITLIQKNLMQTTFLLDAFKDKDILQELHSYFVIELQKLNPEVTFTTTEI